MSARAWPEADVLFHRDARWLGGDAAYSVALDEQRTLWLFGDTFVATSPRNVRSESTLVRNTVAVQRGADPVTASIAFAWGEGEGGAPASYDAGGDDPQAWRWQELALPQVSFGARIGTSVLAFEGHVYAQSGIFPGLISLKAQPLRTRC